MFDSIVPLFYPLSVIFLFLGLLMAIAEILHRFLKVDTELTRKFVHIGSGHSLLLAWLFHIPFSICVGASSLAGIMALISYFVPILPSIESVGRRSFGTFCYALSIGLLSGCFGQINQPQYGVLGILIMAWGDGLAGIIGSKYGKNFYEVMGNKKSWEGSLTMMVMSFLVTIIILGSTVNFSLDTTVIALIVALVATLLESYSSLGIDNLTVPVGSAFLCFVLSQNLLN